VTKSFALKRGIYETRKGNFSQVKFIGYFLETCLQMWIFLGRLYSNSTTDWRNWGIFYVKL